METTTNQTSQPSPAETRQQDERDLMNRSLPLMARVRAATRIVSTMHPTECSCPACRQVCREVPCVGTPEEIEALVKAGETGKLAVTLHLGMCAQGIGGIQLVAPLREAKGCAFLTEDGLCSLHDRGLKPLEGRMSSCKNSHVEALAVSLAAAGAWLEEYTGDL